MVVVGIALGGIQAWCGVHTPVWFPQALALYTYLWIPVGSLAVANATTPKAPVYAVAAPALPPVGTD